MNAPLRKLVVLVAALVLAGCFPEERFWWSPLGDRALVVVDGRLHLVKAGGELGAPLVMDDAGTGAEVRSVSWLPDGTGFTCQRVRVVATWDEVRALVSPTEAEAVESIQPAVLPLLEAALHGVSDAKTLDEAVSTLPIAARKRLGHAVRRQLQQDPTEIEKLLLALPHGSEIVASLKKPENGYDVGEICLVTLEGGQAAKTVSLTRSLLNPALLPRVSPKHRALAFLRLDDEGKSAALEVMSLDGGPALTVARRVSGAFDWMPDGQTLVFSAPIGGDGEKLQSIHRIAVLLDDGTLMKPRHELQANGSYRDVKGTDRLAEPVTLATAIAPNRPALAALADGRVLFASQAVTLPAAGSGAEMESRLYVVSADGKAMQPVPTAPGDLPTNLAFFSASPDGRRVAVVESETDAVAVVEIDSGKTQIISPPHPRWQCTTLPAWKSATELTFAALEATAREPKWMLWSPDGGVRSISAKWPAAATAKWLELKAENKPTTTNTTSRRSIVR